MRGHHQVVEIESKVLLSMMFTLSHHMIGGEVTFMLVDKGGEMIKIGRKRIFLN